MPGTQPGGWMERMKDIGLDILNPIFTDAPAAENTEILELSKQKAKKLAVVMTKASVDRRISLEELKAHNTEAEPWFVVNGEVYDGTPFLKAHPGGAESITILAGEDASEDFMAIHSVVRSSLSLLSANFADIVRNCRTRGLSSKSTTSALSSPPTSRLLSPPFPPCPTRTSCTSPSGSLLNSLGSSSSTTIPGSTSSSSSTRISHSDFRQVSMCTRG